jgi:hypothetical protein
MKKKTNENLYNKLKKVFLEEGEIKLEQVELKGGEVLWAESFEAGESVFLQEGEERTPLPIGSYELSDGRVLVVEAEGIIGEIKAAVAAEKKEEELSDEDAQKIVDKAKANKDELKAMKKENAILKTDLAKRGKGGVNTSPEGKSPALNMQVIPRASMSTPQRIDAAMQLTPFYNSKLALSTTTSITSTYAGESAGMYIAAATLQGATLGGNLITIKPNIKLKEVVKKVVTTGLLADATCDFDPTGTVTITSRILTPKSLQVNLEVCKTDFRSDWDAISMGFSANDILPPTFQAFFAQEIANQVNGSIESAIWHGVEATSGSFGGFVPLMTADGDVIDEAGTTVTASNVIAELTTVVNKIPNNVINEPDMTLYVSNLVGNSYITALGGFIAAGVGGSGTNAQGTQWHTRGQGLSFNGIQMVIVPGLNTSFMVAAQRSNLWYGTGLLDDANSVSILDMAEHDLSQNVRFGLRFTAAVQYGISSEIVLYTPA